MHNLQYEKALYQQKKTLIAGIDEVGRGCIAGPVCACAIIMPKTPIVVGVKDSKKLSAKKREQLFEEIIQVAISYHVAFVDNQQIDCHNILEATKIAMIDAVNSLKVPPQHLLIDALTLAIDVPQTAIIHGDDVCYSIACASIVAKVTRDAFMRKLAKCYPGYDLENNKGYPTKKHIRGLTEKGVTAIHRLTFKPVIFYKKDIKE